MNEEDSFFRLLFFSFSPFFFAFFLNKNEKEKKKKKKGTKKAGKKKGKKKIKKKEVSLFRVSKAVFLRLCFSLLLFGSRLSLPFFF